MPTFSCQNPNQQCSKIFTVSDELIGKTANCPVCGFKNIVRLANNSVSQQTTSTNQATVNSSTNSTQGFTMNYKRNNLYFNPTPERVPETIYPKGIKSIGCYPVVAIIVGFFMLGSPAPALGLIIMGGGIAWIAFVLVSNNNARETARRANEKARNEAGIFNRNRIIVSDAEIDAVGPAYLRENLKSMALRSLGIDEEDVRAREHVCFEGYYYKEIPAASPVQYKRGSDGRYRASNYNAIMFLFSATRIYCYQYRFSLLEYQTQETAVDFLYRDIVSVATVNDSATYQAETERPVTFPVANVCLTTTGGTSIDATILDKDAAELSLNPMKRWIRIQTQA